MDFVFDAKRAQNMRLNEVVVAESVVPATGAFDDSLESAAPTLRRYAWPRTQAELGDPNVASGGIVESLGGLSRASVPASVAADRSH
jgi:hypothetical protein